MYGIMGLYSLVKISYGHIALEVVELVQLKNSLGFVVFRGF